MLLKLGFVHPKLRVPTLILLGVFCGTGLLLAHIARVPSYMIDAPETCMNCHVMTDAFVSHARSPHGRDVSCNDCHLPHTSLAREYAHKAYDGIMHAAKFIIRAEPQVMRLSSIATPVVQENCIRCHEGRVSEVSIGSMQKGGKRCWECHQDVVHGRVRSLSASPAVLRPRLQPVTEFPTLPALSDLPILKDWFGKQPETITFPDWYDSVADTDLD